MAKGSGMAALAEAIALLPGPVRSLAGREGVRIVPADDPSIPETLAAEIARRGRGSFAHGLPSCCHREADGGYLLAIGDPRHLGHELVHLAQDLVPDEYLEASLAAVVAEGGRLAAAARAAVRAGRPACEHRDLAWCRAATRRDDGDPGSIMATFDMNMLVHPVAATLSEGMALGLPGRRAVAAAMFAHYHAANGPIDPGGRPAREIVAHRHEHDLAPLDDLFRVALDGHRPASAPR